MASFFFLLTYSFASLYRRCPCVGIHFISFLTDEERSASLSKDVQMIQPRLTALYADSAVTVRAKQAHQANKRLLNRSVHINK